MSRPLDRRTFLVLLGGGTLTAVAAACDPGSSTHHADLGAIPQVFHDVDALDAIGAHAVGARGVGHDARSIERTLHPDGAGTRWIRTASAPELQQWLQQAISSDFHDARVVDVAGWQLPLTLARVSAFAHLAS